MPTVPRIITQIWDGPIYRISILDSLPISAAEAGKNESPLVSWTPAKDRIWPILLKKSAMVCASEKYASEIEIFTFRRGFRSRISRSSVQKRRFHQSMIRQFGQTDFFNRIGRFVPVTTGLAWVDFGHLWRWKPGRETLLLLDLALSRCPCVPALMTIGYRPLSMNREK